MNKGRCPREVVVEACETKILSQQVDHATFLLHPKMRIGVGAARSIDSSLNDTDIEKNEVKAVQIAVAAGPAEVQRKPPGAAIGGG